MYAGYLECQPNRSDRFLLDVLEFRNFFTGVYMNSRRSVPFDRFELSQPVVNSPLSDATQNVRPVGSRHLFRGWNIKCLFSLLRLNCSRAEW